MIGAINRVFDHDGHEYHIQAEDLGVEHGFFEVRVYDGGAVLWSKRMPYAELIARNLPHAEQDEALRVLMDKTMHTVQAAIAKGKLA